MSVVGDCTVGHSSVAPALASSHTPSRPFILSHSPYVNRTIPVSWEASRQSPLTHLDFHNNLISGTIPDSIAAFTALNFVWLGDNPITGLIPSSIGQLTDLVDFDVTGTQLVGASSGICELTTAMGHCLLSPNPMWVNGSLCPHCLTATSACYRATYHTEAPVICTGA